MVEKRKGGSAKKKKRTKISVLEESGQALAHVVF